LYIVIIVFYMKVELIINGNKRELMIIKELFDGPVGDYCIARNTIRCLLQKPFSKRIPFYICLNRYFCHVNVQERIHFFQEGYFAFPSKCCMCAYHNMRKSDGQC